MGVLDLTPTQIALAGAELLLLLLGGWLILRQFGTAERRAEFLAPGRLEPWSLTGLEVTLLVLLVLVCGAAGQSLAGKLLTARFQSSPDRTGISVALLGAGFHGTALLGWPLLRLVRRHLLADYGPDQATPPPAAPAPRLGWGEAARAGFLSLAMALPPVAAMNFLWVNLLHALGLPDQPQDLVAIFGGSHSGWVFAGMVGVACVLAPLNEELLFRGAIYRSVRQRFGRVVGLLFSGVFFGTLHGNLAGAVPLAVFGMCLALAYERTGDLRVPIVAHALFNVNTIVMLLSGLPQ